MGPYYWLIIYWGPPLFEIGEIHPVSILDMYEVLELLFTTRGIMLVVIARSATVKINCTPFAYYIHPKFQHYRPNTNRVTTTYH